ncbi:hypothetical protein E3A20_22310 [Planctomyces bekefii]|uniref:Uncharacterized protein n=1 Tax=Planctomyces bekefii TaxID=1653850 RepID=A0A5C6M6I0_9PLAN|nr:hypothetical protein E3A20_22310 [Planctomyces bekefii]
MAKMYEVLQMLCPNVEWYVKGQEFDDIDWLGAKAPITKSQYQAGFAKVDELKAQQEIAKTEAKVAAQAKLAALGLTVEDLTALGL